MLSSLKSFIYNFRTNPLRGVLILITVTTGVATLGITLSLSSDINGSLKAVMAKEGRRISIVNGQIGPDGGMNWQQPGLFTPDIINILASDYEKLSDVAYFVEAWIKPIIWEGDKTYEIRSAIQTNESYDELMNLEFVTGGFFEKVDVEVGRPVVVISALAGQMVFGSPQASLGKTIDIASRAGVESFKVIGVYKDVSDVEREAFGIGDFIFPILTGVPEGSRIHPIQRGATLMARIAGDSVEKAESRIRSILESHYGNDLVLSIWEGLPNSAAPLLQESRESVKNFAFAVRILGFIILATSSIGIFSVMIVEVLNRTRDIGLRRALGTTKAGIRRYFIGQALWYSGFGSIIGATLAIALYNTVSTFLSPLFGAAGFKATDAVKSVPSLFPMAIAIGSALLFGALFGFFPAISAARMPIIAGIKEDVA